MTQHSAILHGYLTGTRVLVTLDDLGRITSCSAIRSLWTGSPRFDAPFREAYNPIILYDAGEEYYAWQSKTRRNRKARSVPSEAGLDKMSRDGAGDELIAA